MMKVSDLTNAFRGILIFIVKILTTKNKDLLVVRLGAALTLKQWGLVGPLATVPSFIMRSFMGAAMEAGIFQVDLLLDAYREGEKLEEFKIEARKAYAEATKRIYSEEEKQKIREQYRKIIEGIAPVGKPKP